MLTNPSCQVIAVANDAPGATRTTAAVGLAMEAARAGLRTLLVDLDPEGAATRWLGRAPRPWRRRRHVGTILEDVYPIGWAARLAVRSCWSRHLHVLPASGTTVRGRSPGERSAQRLRLALTTIDDLDLVVIDTPPRGEEHRIATALTAATDLIAVTAGTARSNAGVHEVVRRMQRLRRSAMGRSADPDALVRLRGIIVGTPGPAAGSRSPRRVPAAWSRRVLEPCIPTLPTMDRARRQRRYFAEEGAGGAHLAQCFAGIAAQVIDAYPAPGGTRAPPFAETREPWPEAVR